MNARLSIPLTAAASLLAFAGCSGSHALPTSASQRNVVSSTLTMHWPARTGTSSAARGRKSISPSAQSIVVEVNNDSTLTTVSNRPAGTASATSTVVVLTPPGNDSFTFSVYDAQNGTGNELGQKTVVQAIVAGQNNVINATVDGLVASVQIAPLANQPTVAPVTDPSGKTVYSMLGDVPVTFAATPLDADGNVILGPGDPVSFDASTLSTSITVAPVSGQGNEFTVRASGLSNTAASAGFTVKATDGIGTFTQSNVSLTLSGLTYVAYENAGTGTIAALDSSGTRVALAGSFGGVVDPKGIAYDSQDHRIYVADAGANALLAFNSDGSTFTGNYTPPSLSAPFAVAYDDHTNVLYVLDTAGVHAVNADGSAAPVTTTGTPFGNLNRPTAIAFYEVPVNAYWLFVTNAGNDQVNRYDELGNPKGAGSRNTTSYSLGTQIPTGVASDSGSGTLAYTGTTASGASEIVNWSVAGGFAPLATQTNGANNPSAVAYNAVTDQFFVANAATGTITTYDAHLAGLVQTFAAPASLSSPSALTFIY